MNCCEFREKYSDFTDGLLAPREGLEANAHLSGCAACRRFDAALRTGLDALRSLPSVGLSHGFGPSLRRRLRGEFAIRLPVMARWSGAVGTLLLVATVGFIGWDLLESRASHRERAAWSTTTDNPVPVAVGDQVPTYSNRRPSPADLRFTTFHPLNSILETEAGRPTAAGDRPRLDVPAVWGGP